MDFLPEATLLTVVSLGLTASMAATGVYFLIYWRGRIDYRRDYEAELAKRSAIIDALRENEERDPKEIEELIYYLKREAAETAYNRYRASFITIVAGVGGVIGIASAASAFVRLLLDYLKTSSLFVNQAYAQDGVAPPPKADLSFMIPWIVALLLAVMAAAFLTSLLALLLTKDTPENQSRLKAASDVVKTFGGFFTGIATTLLS